MSCKDIYPDKNIQALQFPSIRKLGYEQKFCNLRLSELDQFEHK